jgi:hypothetical protein
MVWEGGAGWGGEGVSLECEASWSRRGGKAEMAKVGSPLQRLGLEGVPKSEWELLEIKRMDAQQRREQLDFVAKRRAAAQAAAREQKVKTLQRRFQDLEKIQEKARKRNTQVS